MPKYATGKGNFFPDYLDVTPLFYKNLEKIVCTSFKNYNTLKTFIEGNFKFFKILLNSLKISTKKFKYVIFNP